MNSTDKWRPEALGGNGLIWSAAGLLLASIMIGGGGAEAPQLNGLLQAGGALLLCFTVARHFNGRPLPTEAVVPTVLLLAIFLVILAQLLPLPPSWWGSLPGREAAASIYALTDDNAAWHPLSLDPEATRRFAATLLLPASLFFAALGANHNGIMIMAKTVVIGALLSAMLAMAQLVLGLPNGLFPYGRSGAAVPTGLFANPNHQAQLMLAALVTSGLIIHHGATRPRRHRLVNPPFHPAWLLFPVFIAGALMTQSRAGLILLVPALLAAILIAARRRGLARAFRMSMVAIATLAVMMAIVPGGLARGMQVHLELSAGGRITNFPDVLFTLQQFWPWGSGFGTFVPVFKANENLDLMGDAFLNHAHNDLLELLIEGGLPMAVLMVAGLGAMAVRLWRLSRAGRASEPVTALAGLAIILLALIHSLVDYPLRMQSLAAVAAIALAFFQSPTAGAVQGDRNPLRRHGSDSNPRFRGSGGAGNGAAK